MPEYTIDENGNIEVKAKYTNKHIPTYRDIFKYDMDLIEKLLRPAKGFNESLRHEYNVKYRYSLITKIFHTFLLMVLERVANGDAFKFPGKSKMHIRLEKTPQEEIKYMRQRGYFKDYNLLEHHYEIPRFILDFGKKQKGRYFRPYGIFVPRYIRDMAYENQKDRKLTYTKLLGK